MDTCEGGHVSSTVCSDPSVNCDGSSCTTVSLPLQKCIVTDTGSQQSFCNGAASIAFSALLVILLVTL